ncbi:MAG TPA: 2-keto-4-pentenoate hydratase [Casimicrobiaceae bacterium]|jgi:2-keto-4-pentenoate hydratase
MTIDDAAATELARRRREGRRGPRLDPAIRPVTLTEAFALQHRVAARIGTVGGWKCSMPTAERQIAAPIYANGIFRGAHATVHARGAMAQIEPEIAFALAHDLPPRSEPYDEKAVVAAIGETHLVLEILGNRYDDPDSVSFPEMLADGMNNEGLVVGPVVENARVRALEAFTVIMDGIGGFHLERAGRHPDGHPLKPLVWLANFLRERGERLRAGQIVTTGSYAGALDVPLATPLTVTFGTLGQMHVTLDPAR